MKVFGKVFLALMIVVAGCAPLKPLEYRSVSDLKVEKLTSSPEVSVSLNLFNPNSVGCTLKDFNLEFLMSESPLANMKLDNLRLPAHSDFSIPLIMNVSYSDLIKFIPSGVSSFTSSKEIPVVLKGNLTVKKFIFKKTFPFYFEDRINTTQFKIH